MIRTIASLLVCAAVAAACVHWLHYTRLGGCIVGWLLMYAMCARCKP